MAEAAYSYETRLNLLHQPLELIDVKALADACEYKWFNQTLCKVNESVVRVGVIEGEYHWHKHDDDDEFFYVVEGKLLIDLEDRMRRACSRSGLCRAQRSRAPHARSAKNCDPDGGECWDCSHGRLVEKLRTSARESLCSTNTPHLQ